MKTAFQKTFDNLKISLPITMGVLMMISFLSPIFKTYYPQIFTGNYFIDPLIGAVAGSFSFGIPIAAYVTGGELLKEGVSLLAVTAFILSWSTVYVTLFPLEAATIGRKFAIWRNALNFLTSIIIAVLTIITLKFLN